MRFAKQVIARSVRVPMKPQPGLLLRDEGRLVRDEETIHRAVEVSQRRASRMRLVMRDDNRLRRHHLKGLRPKLRVLLIHPAPEIALDAAVVLKKFLIKLVQGLVRKPHRTAEEVRPIDGHVAVVQPSEVLRHVGLENEFHLFTGAAVVFVITYSVENMLRLLGQEAEDPLDVLRVHAGGHHDVTREHEEVEIRGEIDVLQQRHGHVVKFEMEVR